MDKLNEKSNKWDFREDEDGYWSWVRRTKKDKFIAASFRAYLDKEKCVKNAKVNGYNPN